MQLQRLSTCLALVCMAGLAEPPATPGLRLPADVRPIRAALDLTILPASGSLLGKAGFDLQTAPPGTATIWLNGSGLDVTSATYTPAGGEPEPATVRVADQDHLEVRLPKPAAGRGRLEVTYACHFGTGTGIGLFRRDLGTDAYAFTTFEPNNARKAFPCFDQPDIKVPWSLTLHVPQDATALANTPVREQVKEGTRSTRFTFQETRPLPSYLVAFAVGPFECLEAGKGGRQGIPLRVLYPRGLSGQAGFASTTMAPLLTVLEDFFDLPYPYPKLDFLAIPGLSMAMENPGLITFDQTLLLAPPRQATYPFRRGLTVTAAHEMAHQWFGDLVTTAWWNDLWLNEGFASWMETKAAGAWKADWDFGYSERRIQERAMEADSLVTARSIRQPIEANSDMASAFDAITYDKGAAVLAMFEAWIGPEAFRSGIRNYVKAHRDGNATKDDFLGALALKGGKNLQTAFSTFLDQAGLPEVTVELRPVDSGHARVRLAQKRYLPVGSGGSEEGLWQIPVSLRYASHGQIRQERILLDSKVGFLDLPVAAGDLDYLLVNAGGQGYFRTHYSEELEARLRSLASKVLTIPERIRMVQDGMALARSGETPVEQALGWIPILAGDPDRHLQEVMVAEVQKLDAHLIAPDVRPAYAAFIQSTFGARARAMGLVPSPGEDERLGALRSGLVNLVGGPGKDAALRQEAQRLTQAWLADRSAVDPGAIQGIIQLAAMDGDRDLFQEILSQARKGADLADQETLLMALGSFRNPALAAEARDLVLDDHFDPSQRLMILFAQAQNASSQEAVIGYCQDHFERMAKAMPWGLGMTMGWVFQNVDDPALGSRIQAALSPYRDRVDGLARTLDQIQETVRLNAAQKAALAPGASRFLQGLPGAVKTQGEGKPAGDF